MRKRIVVIAEYFPPRLGGDRRIFEIMKRLSNRYDIHFVTLPPSYTLFIRKIDSHDTGENLVLCAGMRGHKIHLPRFIWKLWAKRFLPAFSITMIFLLLKTTRKMAQLKPDIVIIDHTSAYTGLLGFISSKILNRKLLVEYNDLQALYTFDLVKEKLHGFLLTIVRSMLVFVEDTIVKHGWKVTAITDFIKNYASRRKIRKDIVVIPDGVDTCFFDPCRFDGEEIRFKYGVRREEKLCVYTGRIDWCAGAEILVQTANLLSNEADIKFMIVGEGDPQLVNELIKCNNIIYTGPVSKEDVPRYLAAADIVLVPFPSNVASHSISPLKLFEALSMEKPVVASAVSGIKEVLCGDFYGALASDDPKCWASAIMKLLNDKNPYKQERNRKIVLGRYDWNQLSGQFSKVIEDKI